MNTAKELARLDGWRGDARVYEVDPRVEYEHDSECRTLTTKYVIVSAVMAPYSGPETYIFPAVCNGDTFKPANMLELDGSFKGALDHNQALENAGYHVI